MLFVCVLIMSNHQYITNSSNLFSDDADVDDETFLRNSRPKNVPRSNYGGSNSGYGGTLADLEQQRQTMLERQKEIEQRTLDSSSRSIGLLRDSEQIGIATAEELMKQREQLENTNKRLDEINTNLRFSQKHINGIKSVFSSLKNYISGKNEQASKASSMPSESHTGSTTFSSDMFERPQLTGDELFDSHPATRLKGLDSESQRQKYAGQNADSRRINELLDANLDEMVDTITRLKGLGTKLGEEIDSQNDLVDNIHNKVEVADMSIGKQNKQMNKLLGK